MKQPKLSEYNIVSVPAMGEKEGSYMESKIKYTDEPMGKLNIVSDFLPSPEQLVLKENNVKVTARLEKIKQ